MIYRAHRHHTGMFLQRLLVPSEQSPSLLIIGPQEETYATKIWAFDLDSTLIKPISDSKSGRPSANPDDWYFAYDEFITFSKNMPEDEEIVVFSNQKNGNVDLLVKKLTNIMKALGRSIRVFIALKDDSYRKPHTGMWNYFIANYCARAGIEQISAVFVGDAAGRAGDFSCSDRKFAFNTKIPFYTPEEFFKRDNVPVEPFKWDCVDFSGYSRNPPVIPVVTHTELVILIGAPGSGKSSFAKKYFPNYVYINQDTINGKTAGTLAQCLKKLKETLTESSPKRSVVVDNTNAVRETREKLVSIAKKANIPVRGFWLTTPIDVCKHLNQYRGLASPQGLDGGRVVPKIVYDVYVKKFEEPSQTEGFELTKVDFYINDENITNYKF